MGAITFSLDLRLVECLKKALPLDLFIETGTFKGETLEQVHGLFCECFSVELSAELVERARLRLISAKNVQIEEGDSVDFLRRIVPPRRSESVLFWLDAHWCSSSNTAGQTSQCPLIEELRAIGSLNERSVVLIDDARLFLCPPPAPHEVSHWPSFQNILDGLRNLSEQHEVVVFNDVIAFSPREHAPIVANFARRHPVDWLAIKNSADLEPEMQTTIANLKNTIAARNKKIVACNKRISKLKDILSEEREILKSESVKKLELRVKLHLAKERIKGLKSARAKRCF